MDTASTSAVMPLIVPLAALSRADLGRVGGKAANLGELVRAGLPVPPGFALTTAAYDRFLADNALQETVDRSLQAPTGGGEGIREAFAAAPLPDDDRREFLDAYRRLGGGPVAVRSSATAEDLPEASFAGQQDTFLNVVGEQALLEAVRRCWASLWTDRAIAYRDRQGIPQEAVKIAVVVQRMVAAEMAGVLFTANPVTGARGEVVIDASPGLGEAVVAGLVTPDRYVLRWRLWGWRVVGRRLGQREVIVRARAGGGTEHVAGPPAAAPLAFPDRVLYALARYGAAIQRHFGTPQDVEWAWAGGRAYILQARPITALPSPPPTASRLERLVAGTLAEILPIRPYPLDLDTWLPALSGAVAGTFDLFGLHWSFTAAFEVEDGVAIRFRPGLPRLTWRVLLGPARVLFHILRYRASRWRSDPSLAQTDARAADLEALPVGALTWSQLLDLAREAGEIPRAATGRVRWRYLPSAACAALRLRLFLAIVGRASEFATLLSGAEHQTLAMNRAFEALAGQVRQDTELTAIFRRTAPASLRAALEREAVGRAFLADVRAFLDRYGHRETVVSTALQPTWGDQPDIVLGIIRGFALGPPPAPDRPPGWEAARDALLAHPLLRIGPLRAAFLATLAEARALIPLREETHLHATRALPLFRRVFLEMGGRLARAGVLDAPEDVFHLRLAELERVRDPLPPPTDLAAALRAATVRRAAARWRLADVPLVDPRLFSAAETAGDVLLRGTAGSPGVAEGPVRIVQDFGEFGALAAGEVLVAPYTNPSWTPLFQRAVAVVVDSGSPASHAAIVAREYGIPAVMGARTGTRTLRDGQWVRVDGHRGVVLRASGGDRREPEG